MSENNVIKKVFKSCFQTTWRKIFPIWEAGTIFQQVNGGRCQWTLLLQYMMEFSFSLFTFSLLFPLSLSVSVWTLRFRRTEQGEGGENNLTHSLGTSLPANNMSSWRQPTKRKYSRTWITTLTCEPDWRDDTAVSLNRFFLFKNQFFPPPKI